MKGYIIIKVLIKKYKGMEKEALDIFLLRFIYKLEKSILPIKSLTKGIIMSFTSEVANSSKESQLQEQ
ncbi:TPA: hypothetical protein I9094_003374 [Clostridium perfringens]|nr:hypothetical protein [Clostridium perfringens]